MITIILKVMKGIFRTVINFRNMYRIFKPLGTFDVKEMILN